MIKISKFQYLPVIVVCAALFVNLIAAVLLAVGMFFLYAFLLNVKPRFGKIDILLYLYFLYATLLYYALGLDLRQYVASVFFPVLVYSGVCMGSAKMNDLKVLKFFLACFLVYCVLIFFRDTNGGFSLSLANNFFMQQRQLDESMKEERPSIFFMNPTLMSLWLVATFVFAQSLYNRTKKKLYLLCMVLLGIMIFLSNTRSAIGCTILIILIDYVAVKRKLKRLILLPILVLPVIFIIVSSLGNVFQFQSERLGELFAENSDYGLGTRYEIYWPTAIMYTFKNFWGNGHYFLLEKIGRSTHNEYLGQAMAVGIVAAIVYYWFIFYYLLRNYRITKTAPLQTNTWNEIAFYLTISYLTNGITEQISLSSFAYVALIFIAIGWSKKAALAPVNANKKEVVPLQKLKQPLRPNFSA
ncbi:O-antigen ligase family protein [Foetidibacter luteolus]|uniref:O-antigen ligase family protein n=1 Tax=Foetidibacter luteolus TaxID=2608880 RepID=UPI00129A5ADF|nr:O-antigen ligase family protein [Foetidibacter luteolus]